jgi:HAMP domain-containing protein
MGVTGHIGLAFDPVDESIAIAAVNGEHEGDEWLRYQTECGLIRENYWELHLVMQKLAAMEASLSPLATVIVGTRTVGDGPTYPMCLYPADEVEQIAKAFTRIDDAALERAIDETRDEAAKGGRWFPSDLPETFRRVGSEMEKVAANGWSLIGFMF